MVTNLQSGANGCEVTLAYHVSPLASDEFSEVTTSLRRDAEVDDVVMAGRRRALGRPRKHGMWVRRPQVQRWHDGSSWESVLEASEVAVLFSLREELLTR